MEQSQREMSAEPLSFSRTVFNTPTNVDSNVQRRPVRHRHRNHLALNSQCEYCFNRMPQSSLNGHLRRKHSQLIRTIENHGSKRSHSEYQDEMSVSFGKRQRLDMDQFFDSMVNGSSALQTPSIPLDFEEPVTTPFVQFDGMSYNLVHVSDFELNKLIENGLIRIHDGNLFLMESERDQPNEGFEQSSEMRRDE